MDTNTIYRTLVSGFSWIAPQCCVICGSVVEPELPWPLCMACAGRINIDTGRRCDVCGKPLISELTRCMRCRSAAVSFDAAFPLYSYAGIVRKLLIAYKEAKRKRLSVFLARRLVPEIKLRFSGYTIVPVPPRPGKIRSQGWDQVELLARHLEKQWALPVGRFLVRNKGGNEQKTLDREGRRINVVGRYALLPKLALRHEHSLGNIAAAGSTDNSRDKDGAEVCSLVPKKVLLLDDIMTTGATLSECAAVLKANGSKKVCAIVVAAD